MKLKILIFIGLVCLAIVSANAQNADASKLATIKTVGTAEIQVIPDTATMTLRVSKTDKNLVGAKKETDENIGKIIALSKRFGIAATDVKTDYISVKEKYESVKEPGEQVFKSVFVGYTVSKTLVVKLKDLGKFEDFFSEVVKIGVSDIGDVEFETSQLRKYKDQARQMAIRAAREKAQLIAGEIKQTIGKAVLIEENDVDRYSSPNSNYRSNSFSNADNDDEDVAAFSVGTITVKAQVEVRFLLN
jgi:uncharacterized protein YggE